MENHELIMQRFAGAFKQALLSRFGKLPSTSFIAYEFNQQTSGRQTVTRETARKWLKGLAYPEVSRLQVLVDWLHLNPVDILVARQLKNDGRRARKVNKEHSLASLTAQPKQLLFAQQALDALSAHIAILDNQGNILQVNRSWHDFAVKNSTAEKQKSNSTINYLDLCDHVRGSEQGTAQTMAAGIRAVLNSTLTEFALKYPCHSPTEKRWFVARTTRFMAEGLAHAVVSHETVSEDNWKKLDFPEPFLS